MILIGAGVLLAGCYALQPVAGVGPDVGSQIAVDLNDAGRVALGGSMGPAIRQITGRLQAKDGDDYVVSVTNVELIQGGYQAWRGEQVRINNSYVSALYRRQFSKARTIALGAVAVGLAAGLVGRSLAPSFVDQDSTPVDTIRTQRRRPMRPLHPPFLRSFNPPRSY